MSCVSNCYYYILYYTYAFLSLKRYYKYYYYRPVISYYSENYLYFYHEWRRGGLIDYQFRTTAGQQ